MQTNQGMYHVIKDMDYILICPDLTQCLRVIAKRMGNVTINVTVKEAMEAGFRIARF